MQDGKNYNQLLNSKEQILTYCLSVLLHTSVTYQCLESIFMIFLHLA